MMMRAMEESKESTHNSKEAEDDDLFDVAILIDELRHEEVQYRMNSMQKLTVIADALGTERTRDELIPFLASSTDDDDEVLVAMAEQLGQFVPYVGGKEYAYKLLEPLEKLAHVEEMAVRDKTIEALNNVASQMPTQDLVTYFVPLIKRLASKDWFTSRISAAGIIAVPYEHVTGDASRELAEIFQRLVEDDTPMVRRAACAHLGTLSKRMSSGECEQIMLPLLKRLASDEQDSVRLLAVDNCCVLSPLVSSKLLDESLLPTIMLLAKDKSWRVRWSVANKFVSLCDALGTEITQHQLVEPFQALMEDREAEVRTAAASAITQVSKHLSPEGLSNYLLPKIRPLAEDRSDHVRKALAETIMGLAVVLGEEKTKEHLLPLILHLLKDIESQVRLNIISNLEKLNEVIGVKILSESLLPAIIQLSHDKQWRVRMAMIEFMPLLANQLGVSFFDKELTQRCAHWLSDDVASIREIAAVNLRKLTEIFGVQWANSQIIHQVEQLSNAQSYLVRITSIHALCEIGFSVDERTRVDRILPAILRQCQDPIANVRFNVAKGIHRLIPHLPKQSLSDTVKPQLQRLSRDIDADVQFFSVEALNDCPV